MLSPDAYQPQPKTFDHAGVWPLHVKLVTGDTFHFAMTPLAGFAGRVTTTRIVAYIVEKRLPWISGYVVVAEAEGDRQTYVQRNRTINVDQIVWIDTPYVSTPIGGEA